MSGCKTDVPGEQIHLVYINQFKNAEEKHM